MRKFNLNWGVMLAAIVLLGYTYISFLGMLYKVDGVMWKAVLYAVVVIALVSACVYVMVSAKVTKSKMAGLVGQLVFGGIILATFLVSGGPFTSFLKVAGSQNEITEEMANVKSAASGLDVDYNQYVEMRVQDYKSSLPDGNELKVQSLQRRLGPDSIADVQQQRKEWMDQIEGMSIWNIKLPQNLQYMKQCVSDWTDNYKDLSNIAYDNEQLKPFEYEKFNTSLDALMDSFKNAGYSFWAILAAVFSAFVMMIPYWLAIPVPTDNRKKGEIRYR